MSQQKKIKTNFLKGINRRFSREESSDPSFFYTLQNARIYNRGETGIISRINGYTPFVSNSVDYSNVLDVVVVDEHFVFLYKDIDTSGKFWVEVFDVDGVSVYSEYYENVEDLSYGKLTNTNNTVFIAPHNKVLYYDDGWTLEDFKSSVPTVQGEDVQSVNIGTAKATIEPTSDPISDNVSSKATAQLMVRKNNTVQGKTDDVTLTVGSNETDAITISYQMSEYEITQEFYYALRGENGYTDVGIINDWDISLSKNQQNRFVEGSQIIFFSSKDTNTDRNDDSISINGSSYTIVVETNDYGGSGGSGGSGGHREPGGIRRQGGGYDHPERVNNTFSRTIEGISASVYIGQPSGAIDPDGSFIGPLYIRFANISHTVKTDNIVTSDTVSSVTNKIENALDSDSVVTDDFSISSSGGVVTITADNYGEKYNGEITLRFKAGGFVNASQVFSYNKSDFTGGEEVDVNLSLEKETNYWYKARYKYIDGHVSEDCFPIRINTGSSQVNPIVFDTPDKDLDGSNPQLQIFRKKEGENFFLVEEKEVEGATTEFVDDGYPKRSSFDDANLVWTKNHYTQTVVDNRLVRANVEYDSEKYNVDDGDFTVSTESSAGEETLPPNTKARFYVRPQYNDGTKGYFENIGILDVQDTGMTPAIEQNTTLQKDDKDINELGFYVNYKPHGQENIYRFNSVEISNQHVSAIHDSSFYPSTTRVLFGFKYLEVWEIVGDDPDAFGGVFKAVGWDTENSGYDHGGFQFDKFDESGDLDRNKFPKELTTTIFGIDFTYVRHGYYNSNTESTNAIYKLADYEALKRAVATGKLEIRLTNSNVGNLSTKHPDNEIFGEKVKVKGIIDESSQYDDLSILNEDEDVLIGPLDSRLYLELEDSVLDDIDNINLTQYSLKGDYGRLITSEMDFGGAGFEKFGGVPISNRDLDNLTMGWELTNFKKLSDPVFDPYTGDGSDKDQGRPDAIDFGIEIFRYEWDYSKYEVTSSEFFDIEDSVIFIGRKENQESTASFPVAGVEYVDETEITYGVLLGSNIYEQPIFDSDFNIEKVSYPNQIIWSNPINTSTGFSGGRSFELESFFSIGSENGDIINIETLGNKVYVFCENGLAVVNVGEVLTTQKEGEVFVDSSTFMTNYYWINDRLVDVKRKSIVKYKNVIYFTDGYDVYQLSTEGLNNLSSGVIKLDPEKEYYGAINPKFSEYQICDYSNSETWVYNFEFQQWVGPFTYKFKDSQYVKHTFLTVDDKIYEHGIGNTFGGKSYTTLIQNVASDTKSSISDKNFRKFYINTENEGSSVFKYGKDPDFLANKSISNMISKNGFYHQGVRPSEQNNKVIYWDIETTSNNFKLKDFSYIFNQRRRL